MSIAEQLDIEVSDEELPVHLIRNATEWRAIGDDGFAVDLKEPITTLRLTIPKLYDIDARLCSALIYLRDNDRLNYADKLLRYTLSIWGHSYNKCLQNEKAGYWERWRNVEFDEETETFQIDKLLYKAARCSEGVFVVTEQLGSMTMRYHDFEIEALYPGFMSAYTVAEQLGMPKTDIANHCHAFMRGIQKQAVAQHELPAFE